MLRAKADPAIPSLDTARRPGRVLGLAGGAMRKLILGLALLGAVGLGYVAHPTADPFNQRNFPCQEDEALVYAPQFGPDRVGCLHIEGGQLAPEVWK